MVTKKDDTENVDKNDVIVKRDPEIIKKETADLAKKKSAELVKKDTGGLAKQVTQPSLGNSFTWEETAWLVVFVIVILVPMFLPNQFLNDNQVSSLLFVVAPVMGWFVRLVYIDVKRYGK